MKLRNAGFPFNADYNGVQQDGVSHIQLSQRRGLRHSTARSYLSAAWRRPNVTVRTNTQVSRVLIERGRAIGVEFLRGGQVERAYCDGEIILSAGAFGSPKILLLSGIGQADELRRMEIDVVVDLPGVGQNLQEHIWTPFQHEVNVDTLNQEVSFVRTLKHGLDFIVHGRGPATATVGTALVFDRLTPDSMLPDFQLMFGPLRSVRLKTMRRGRSETDGSSPFEL